jgi:hypothetical protein
VPKRSVDTEINENTEHTEKTEKTQIFNHGGHREHGVSQRKPFRNELFIGFFIISTLAKMDLYRDSQHGA